jgi:putative restriction endonuclease
VDPGTDLVPLCANCHTIAHRRRGTVTSIEELKELIEKVKGYGSSAKRASNFGCTTWT